jgi:small subunit ribosomal protein S11
MTLQNTTDTAPSEVTTGEVTTGEVKSKKNKFRRACSHGAAHIYATFNNTHITITDPQGNTICSSSAGQAGFSGARQSTPFAAQVASEQAASKARDKGMNSVDVYLLGPGPGRESAIRALKSGGLRVTSLNDKSGIPHNGCRSKKQRRI